MTNDKTKFIDGIPEEDKRLYSVNFLVSRFERMETLQRDEQMLQNKLPSGHYQTRDFSTHRFYKTISTPLSRVRPAPREDE